MRLPHQTEQRWSGRCENSDSQTVDIDISRVREESVLGAVDPPQETEVSRTCNPRKQRRADYPW